MNPSISVIIPIFNKELYIEELVSSIHKQTFTDFECIIVDDGSTDNSSYICEKASQRDKRIQVIKTENFGVSHARNIGLNASTGDYVTFMDSDDSITENYLEILYQTIASNDSDLLVSGIITKTRDDKKIEVITPKRSGKFKLYEITDYIVTEQYSSGLFGYLHGKMFKGDIIRSIRFDESIDLAEDLDYCFSVYPMIQNIFILSDSYYTYYLDALNNSKKLYESVDYLQQARIHRKIFDYTSRRIIKQNIQNIIEARILDYIYFYLYDSPYADIKRKRKDIKELLDGVEYANSTYIKESIIRKNIFYSTKIGYPYSLMFTFEYMKCLKWTRRGLSKWKRLLSYMDMPGA